jgi:hypothetical protein
MIRQQYYYLNDTTPVSCEYDEWLKGKFSKIVAQTSISNTVRVSTVFIGIEGCIFETKLFGGDFNDQEYHTSTWIEAENTHNNVVNLLNKPIIAF